MLGGRRKRRLARKGIPAGNGRKTGPSEPRPRASCARTSPPGFPSERPPPNCRAKKSRPLGAASCSRENGLLRGVQHVVDGFLDQVVRHIHAAALGGHHAGGAGEALDGVLVQHVLALGDAGRPGRHIARLRGAADAGAMARLAGLLVQLIAVLRRGRAGSSTRGGRRLDFERRVVLARRPPPGRTAGCAP